MRASTKDCWILMSGIFDSELDSILEGTSRSFFLSLKELPKPIRSQVSLLYMLARTSDTIADSKDGTLEERLIALESFNEYSKGNTDKAPNLHSLASQQTNDSEGLLLDKVEEVTSMIGKFSESDQEAIRRCLGIIIGGQKLDLERFSVSGKRIIPIENEEELDDYAYRVAGSVGEFWTRMSLAHLFQINSELEKELFEHGIRFGKALQMINILRDIPSDLSLGRCYIPRESLFEFELTPEDLLNPEKMSQFRPLYDRYLDLTDSHFGAAIKYIEMIPHTQFRFRGACMLPVIIGKRTAAKLREGNVLDSRNRIKIDRTEIKSVVNRLVLAVPFKSSSKKILSDPK